MSESFPRPGSHLPSQHAADGDQVDPDAVLQTVSALIAEADTAAAVPTGEGTADPHGLVTLTRQGQILERAHQSLVDTLAAVDKN